MATRKRGSPPPTLTQEVSTHKSVCVCTFEKKVGLGKVSYLMWWENFFIFYPKTQVKRTDVCSLYRNRGFSHAVWFKYARKYSGAFKVSNQRKIN